MTKNQIEYWKHKEQQQYNSKYLAELNRSNRAKEDLQKQINAINLDLGKGNLGESIRSHQAQEREANRSNLARETETRRSNLANEGIAQSNATTNYLNALTNARNADTNSLNAQTNISTLAETFRSNKANEILKGQQNEEQKRSNLALEGIRNYDTVTKNSETKRHNVSTETETKRNNLINQKLETTKQLQTINRDKFTTLANLISGLKPNVGARLNF